MHHVELKSIIFPSIYQVNGSPVPMPKRMAQCTPDLHDALFALQDKLPAPSRIILSDLYRSHDMQLQAHLDYITGKKKAYSPAPGGSMHEAGRAFDLSLNDLLVNKDMTLARFWELARSHGIVPIVKIPSPKQSEAWHFERRGSHQLVYDYYTTKEDANCSPYEAMVTSALLDIGNYESVRIEGIATSSEKQQTAYAQSLLIRQGYAPGNIDGQLGPKTFAALKKNLLRIGMFQDISEVAAVLEKLVSSLVDNSRSKFPGEWYAKANVNSSLA